VTDDRLETKLDKIVDDVGEIKVHLGVYNVQLKEHMKRTELLEKKLEPVEKHVERLNGILKLIGVMAMIATIVEAILRAMGKP
jgi:hypothetical protein